ncbi:MAG: LysR family transcriptional regulator [Synergistaceae bacterium]|jgi:DNA-binding transcriptional LysR family regulator|nr:LysR family transcriptional regulator [Synergistaceae bacterium]
MNLSLREIEYVLTIREEGNITRAAKKLFIAQPSLSQALKKIEDELGAKLFIRAQNEMTLTAEGEMFVQAGRSILQSFNKMKDDIEKSIGQSSRTIQLGAPPFLGSFLFPRIMETLRSDGIDVEMQFTEANSLELENKLIRREIELALLPTPLISNGLQCRVFHTGRMILLIPAHDQLNQYGYIKSEDDYPYLDIRLTEKKDYLVGKPGQRVRHINEIIFQKARIEPNMIFCSQSIETIKRVSATGAGIAIIPEYYLEKLGAIGGVNCYNIEPEYSYEWSLVAVCRDFDSLSAPAKMVLEIVDKLYDKNSPKQPRDITRNP